MRTFETLSQAQQYTLTTLEECFAVVKISENPEAILNTESAKFYFTVVAYKPGNSYTYRKFAAFASQIHV